VKARKTAKVVLDIAMALVLVAIMSTALVQEAPHEWLGVTLFVLLVVHIVLNRKWLASVFRGRHNALRIVQIVVVVGLAACIVGQVASSLVLSKHAFGFLPAFPGAGWARRVHMICSYWAFMLAFAHAGLHARLPRHMATWQLWTARIAFAAIACYGVYSFVQLDMTAYLLGQVQFAAADYEAPLVLTCARYASIGVLTAGLFHYIQAAARAARQNGGKSNHVSIGGMRKDERSLHDR